MNAREVPVFCSREMKKFLKQNGPWNQLVNYKNICINIFEDEKEVKLAENFSFKPVKVPHRHEYTDTYGFIFKGPQKKLLYIPDVDKWNKMNISIRELISSVDYAIIDGTFYSPSELNLRDMSEVKHPLIPESISLLKNLAMKTKIIFTHFNHTNLILDDDGNEKQEVEENGFLTGKRGMIFEL